MSGIASTQNPFYSVGGFTGLLFDNLPVKRVVLPATTTSYNLTANSDNRIVVALPTMTANCTVFLPPVASSVGQVFSVVLDGDLNGVNTVIMRCNGAETVLCGQLTNRFRQFNVQQVDLTARARTGTFIQAVSDGTKWIYSGVSTHDLSYSLAPGDLPITLTQQDSGLKLYLEGGLSAIGVNEITLPVIAGSNGVEYTFYIEAKLDNALTVQCAGGANLMCATLIDKEAGGAGNDKAEMLSKANTANFIVSGDASTGTWFTLYCNGERWFAHGASGQAGAFA